MDYSQLPDDIIEKIARDHLPPTDAQLITLPAVCKSWRSVLRRGSPRIPGLLSSPALGSRYCTAVHKFVPLTCNILADTRPESTPPKDTLPHVTLPIFPSTADMPNILLRRKLRGRFHSSSDSNLPSVIEKQHYLTSFDGWLLISEQHHGSGSHDMHLLNPITNVSISLPDHPPFLANALSSRHDVLARAVLSCSPDNAAMDCYVILLLTWSPYLTWCKVSGDDQEYDSDSWKFLESSLFETRPRDIAYFGETLYVRDFTNVYAIHDLIDNVASSFGKEPSVTSVSLSSLPCHSTDNRYHLAPDLDGQLLIIGYVKRTSLRVHKLVIGKWEEVKRLDGYAVFLGSHQGFSLRVASRNGVEPNRIYFLGIHGYECVVVSLENRTSERLVDPDKYDTLVRSFWFLPMPWRSMKSPKRAFDVDEDDEEKDERAKSSKSFSYRNNYDRTKRLRK